MGGVEVKDIAQATRLPSLPLNIVWLYPPTPNSVANVLSGDRGTEVKVGLARPLLYARTFQAGIKSFRGGLHGEGGLPGVRWDSPAPSTVTAQLCFQVDDAPGLIAINAGEEGEGPVLEVYSLPSLGLIMQVRGGFKGGKSLQGGATALTLSPPHAH